MRGSVDIASFEWLVEGAYPGFSSPGLPPELRAGYVTRLGARISNAPYCWPELYVTYDPRRPNDASGRYFGPGHENLHKVMAFDCFANRGLLDHAYWYQHKRSPGTDESAGFVNAFIEGLPSALSRREYAADIGLVFNPWCDVAESTVAGMRHEAFLEAYSGWADFLTLEHDQWRVVLAGELCEMDLDSLAVLLLPSVTVLNDAQMAAIRAYASSGGRVVATGGTGTRGGPEGYFARRDEPLEGIARVRRTRAQPGRLFRRQGRASELRAQMSRLLKFEDVTWSVETQGPETVGVNLSVILDPPKDPVFTLDLNNYDVDRDTDRLSPAPAIPVTLRPPDGLRFDPSAAPRYVMANAGAPFIEKALPAEGYSVSEGGRRATLELPPFDYYMMVIWSGVS
jgi:hypothetical protein